MSTTPGVAPSQLIRSIKGRLQHQVRRERPKAFRRNYSLHSIGSATRETVGCGMEESPEDVALAYMNSLAFA